MTTDISVSRWDPSIGHGQEIIDEIEYDGGNSSSRLFERSRIKALAGEIIILLTLLVSIGGAFITLIFEIFNWFYYFKTNKTGVERLS